MITIKVEYKMLKFITHQAHNHEKNQSLFLIHFGKGLDVLIKFILIRLFFEIVARLKVLLIIIYIAIILFSEIATRLKSLLKTTF